MKIADAYVEVTAKTDKAGKGIDDLGTKASGLSARFGDAFEKAAAKSPMLTGALDKVGLSGAKAGSMIATALPGAALAAGAAIGVFALKSIGEFEKTALAADKFRDATGLSLDLSSKWIAVADDVGVSAGTIQTAFGKMERAIDTNRKAFGDLVVTAKDGSIDLGATFLNVIKHVQGIKDPIERANESAKLFGRGFAEVSDIISTDADTLTKKLSEVSDAQIIDEAEVRKARDYQAAMDNLGDAVKDLQIAFGEALVPAISDATNSLTGFIDLGKQVNASTGGFLDTVVRSAREVLDPVERAKHAWKDYLDIIGMGGDKAKGFGDIHRNVFSEAVGAVQRWSDQFPPAGEAGADAMDVISAAYDALKGNLAGDEAILNLQDQFDEVGRRAKEAWDKTAAGADDAKQAVRDSQKAVIDLKQKVIDYAAEVGNIPPKKTSDILALIDQGKLAEARTALENVAAARAATIRAADQNVPYVEERLASLARNRTSTITVNTVGYQKLATGGPVNPGTYMVGEAGPEILSIDAHGRGSVTNAGETARQGAGTQGGLSIGVLNVGDRGQAADVTDAIDRYWWKARNSA